MDNKISPVALFAEWKDTLVSDIGPLEWPYVRLWNQQYRRSVGANLHWLQPFHDVFIPDFGVPQNATEIKDFGSFGILGMPWALHQMGITLNELLNEVSEGLLSVIAAEGAKIEARCSKMERDSAEFGLWLDKHVRAMAGSLVDLHFFRYKRYHPVSGAKADAILETLEEAGQRSLITGVFRHFKDHAEEIGIEPLLPLLQRDWDFEKPLQTMGRFSAMLVPSMFDLGEVLIARLTDRRGGVRGLLEEKICNGVSESCERLVQVMERYEDWPRRTDPQLTIVGFNPREALYLSIIDEADQTHRTMVELCLEVGVNVQEVRNFKRRLDYTLQKQLQIPH